MARIVKNVTLQVGETFKLVSVIRDEAGAVIDLTNAGVGVTLSYYRDDTKAAINSRNAQAVVTAGSASNQHAVTNQGVLTWTAVAADTNIVITQVTSVVARYTVTFPTSRVLIQEIEFKLQPLATLV